MGTSFFSENDTGIYIKEIQILTTRSHDASGLYGPLEFWIISCQRKLWTCLVITFIQTSNIFTLIKLHFLLKLRPLLNM